MTVRGSFGTVSASVMGVGRNQQRAIERSPCALGEAFNVDIHTRRRKLEQAWVALVESGSSGVPLRPPAWGEVPSFSTPWVVRGGPIFVALAGDKTDIITMYVH